MTEITTLTWILARFTELWADTTGRIFVISVLGYSVSYLVYAGYLTRFNGGIGSLPFNVSDLSLSDILAMFPLGFYSLALLLADFLRELFFLVFNYIFSSFLIGIFLGLMLSLFNIVIPTWLFLLGALIIIFPILIAVMNNYKFLSLKGQICIIMSGLGVGLVSNIIRNLLYFSYTSTLAA